MGLCIVVIGMGLITFALRLALIIGANRISLPATLEQALRFAPVAVLSAIIFLEIALRQGALYLSVGNARLVAGAVAAVVAWRTKNVLLTIAAGMIMLWFMQWLDAS